MEQTNISSKWSSFEVGKQINDLVLENISMALVMAEIHFLSLRVMILCKKKKAEPWNFCFHLGLVWRSITSVFLLSLFVRQNMTGWDQGATSLTNWRKWTSQIVIYDATSWRHQGFVTPGIIVIVILNYNYYNDWLRL